MLEIDNIQVQYGSIVALRGVSVQVNEGEMVALLGANGAGKTTTISAVAGVLKTAKGSIRFEGEQIDGESPEAIIRKGIATVPEGRDIFPSLSVEENLRLGAYIRHDRVEFRRDLEQMIARFPVLGERLRQAGGTLSGGEQQQLAIARALMSHPKLLMLDEPSLGLAPALVDQIFELIVQLHEDGVTILLVEQNVERTLEIVDRAYLLRTGTVAVAGTPSELREHVDIADIYLGG